MPTDGTTRQPSVNPVGNEASVWRLVSRPGVLEGLRSIARRKKRDWPFASWSADSVTDDTLIRMTGQRSIPDEPAAFLAAFTEQLKRTIADKYRKKNAQKRKAGRARQAVERLLGVTSRANGIDPDIAGLIDEYVRTKPLLAVIAWMSADLGLTEDEMAPLLGIEPASVQTKLRRVKAELRSELDPHE